MTVSPAVTSILSTPNVNSFMSMMISRSSLGEATTASSATRPQPLAMSVIAIPEAINDLRII